MQGQTAQIKLNADIASTAHRVHLRVTTSYADLMHVSRCLLTGQPWTSSILVFVNTAIFLIKLGGTFTNPCKVIGHTNVNTSSVSTMFSSPVYKNVTKAVLLFEQAATHKIPNTAFKVIRSAQNANIWTVAILV